MLLKKKKDFPDEELILFKSDISDAYHNLPIHPLWQIKQINTIQKRRHVDRCNCFRGKGSGSLFIVQFSGHLDREKHVSNPSVGNLQ